MVFLLFIAVISLTVSYTSGKNSFSRLSITDIEFIIKKIYLNEFEDAVLLCSEPTAKQCHRRLASEYLLKHFGNINIKHL